MKIRSSFVTNSSSSSFICVLAKVADKEKAQPIIEKNGFNVYTGKEAKASLVIHDVDWAGVWFDKEDLDDDAIYVYYYDCVDIDDAGWTGRYDFDEENHSIAAINTIDSVTEDNGFIDIDVQYGAGRNG